MTLVLSSVIIMATLIGCGENTNSEALRSIDQGTFAAGGGVLSTY